MEFDMNQLAPASNPEPKNDSSENQTSENPSGNNAVQTGETENVDSNTLAAVLQFLQKHNLKVSYATFETCHLCHNQNKHEHFPTRGRLKYWKKKRD